VSTFSPLRIAVLTVSDTRTLETDKSGGFIVDAVQAAGHALAFRKIVPDDLGELKSTFQALIAEDGVDVILATGGTGITARDVTPDALESFVTKWIPGFGELFRYLSYADIGAATIQSRAEAALCGGTLVFALPGSTGAVKLALEKIILPQLDSRTKPCNFAELLPRVRGTARG
jgi:molybdenum cofactor biosynthesis protein B